MKQTEVVHCRDAHEVYIGRAVPRSRVSASPWGNPFRVGDAHPFVADERIGQLEAVRLYSEVVLATEEDLHRFVASLIAGCCSRSVKAVRALWEQAQDRDAILALAGQRLGCWCAPKGERWTAESPDPPRCHGQVLAALADHAKEKHV